MSKADERRAEQLERERDADAGIRPEEAVTLPNPNLRAWSSVCAGWRGGIHEVLRKDADGWVCRWCFQALQPGTPEEYRNMRERYAEVPHIRSWRRGGRD